MMAARTTVPRMDQTPNICSWCSAEIPAGASSCPKCGAVVVGASATDIPGLTVPNTQAPEIPDEGRVPDDLDPVAWLRAGHDGPDPVAEEAVAPPTEAVRLEMRKLELEAEIENAGSEVMNPNGDESIDVGAPSREAIEAYEAGLLDATGPAGETDLGELASPWEDPELEKRLEAWREQNPNRDTQ
jgi:ribosomal protein L40E